MIHQESLELLIIAIMQARSPEGKAILLDPFHVLSREFVEDNPALAAMEKLFKSRGAPA